MSDQMKWIWPVVGTLGLVVAFGSGVSVGDRWISLTFGPKSIAPAAIVDPEALRPIVRDEVKKGMQDALNSKKDAIPAKDVSPQSMPARAYTLIATIHSVRGQLTQYRAQHHDHYPTLAQLKDWAALTQPTNSDGSLAGGTVQTYGPYAQVAPVNSMTNFSELAPAGAPTATCGWTYDERTGRVRAYVPYGHPGGEFVADAYVERGTIRRANMVTVTR